jgi:cobalt/nickel transport system permease protein
MSHIHIPDGVLPLWLVLAGWVATAVVLSFCIRRARNVQLGRRLPLIGIVSALMIIGMMLEIFPIAYHINMGVIAGIVLGPTLVFIAVFIVNLIVAMFGHGGITVVGLNTLIVGTEAVLGFYLFRAFLGVLSWIRSGDLEGGVSGNLNSRLSAGLSAALATVFSLIISTSLVIGVVYLSQVNPERMLHIDEENPVGKIFSLKLHGEHEKHEMQDKRIDIGKFAKAVLFLGMFGWILEAVITGFVIRYVFRVRPDLILSEVT